MSLVVGGVERAHELVSSALVASGRRDLPREPAVLCQFARQHLLYGLIDELGPRLAATVLDELTRELLRGLAPNDGSVAPSNEDSDDAPSSSVRHVESRSPAGGATALARITPQSRSPLTEDSASGVRAVRSERPRVAIIEPNAFVRSSLSRALVRAGYDVAAIERLDKLQAEDEYAAVVVCMRSTEVEAALAAVLALDPPVPLVAYFADETNLAFLRAAGAMSAVVVSALCPLDQVVASVASVIEQQAPNRRR